MLLSREASEILLPFLQSAGFRVRRSLEIHSEPENGDHHPGNSGSDVLCHLPTMLTRQILNFLVVSRDLCVDLIARQHIVGWVYRGDRVRRPPSTPGKQQRDAAYYAFHGSPPPEKTLSD
jgi:hypothetical protein